MIVYYVQGPAIKIKQLLAKCRLRTVFLKRVRLEIKLITDRTLNK